MEEMIKNRMKSAYDKITLEEELRLKAKKKLLAKAKSGSRRKVFYSVIAAAAVVVLFIIGNLIMIRWNNGRGHEVTPLESNTPYESEKWVDGYEYEDAIEKLKKIETMEEYEEMAFSSNVYRRIFGDMGENFCVAVLCYDEDFEQCKWQNGMQATNVKAIVYAYYKFDENGKKVNEYYGTYDIDDAECSFGAVYMNGDWYAVMDSIDVPHYEIYNVTSPEKSSYARHTESEDDIVYINENAQFFARNCGDYIVVGGTIPYGKTLELSQVESKHDLEELMNQSNVYYIACSDNSYLVAQAFDGNDGSEFASSYEGQHEYVKVGHFVVDGETVFLSPIIELTGEGNAMETMGITCFKGTWYLFGKLKDFEQYKLINLTTGTEEIMYCDEGICREILSGETIDYFAKSVGNYWMIGSEVVTKEKKDSKTYCDNHEWEEMCTSEMSVRDIYVAQNWIGRSANDYILLELFFDDLVMTDFEDDTAMWANSGENAYQVNNRFSEVNFQVSTELDSDEIIAVTLFGDHCYVTEDVWIGMDRDEVTEKMGIEDNLNQGSFEKDGYIYTFFEKDGYLYEFRFVTAFVDAGNLPEHASHPWTEKYVLDCACISDAAKIKESSVKSFGERLEEGRNILPQ